MAQIIHTSPNFNVNSVNGWHTRLIYSFYGNKLVGEFNYVSQTFGNYTLNIFEVLKNWQISTGFIATKGNYTFGTNKRFLCSGKIIRIKGSLLVSVGDPGNFNMTAQIKNISQSNLVPIAAQNNGQNHSFVAGGDSFNLVPVNFEIIYRAIETDKPGLFIGAEGFYQYNRDSYDSGGNNLSNAYVPIVNLSINYIEVGNPDESYELYLSFDNTSSTIGSIILRNLTVEEIS